MGAHLFFSPIRPPASLPPPLSPRARRFAAVARGAAVEEGAVAQGVPPVHPGDKGEGVGRVHRVLCAFFFFERATKK